MSVPQASATGGSKPPPVPVSAQVRAPGIVMLAVFMSAVALLALFGLWRFWPVSSPATGTPLASAGFSYFRWHLTLTRDQQFFMITALAGVIGAMVHGLRSAAAYIGERYLFRSWIPYYLLLPLVGGLLATIVYLVLRAGLLPGGNSSQPDPYGIGAISALVGLFSAQTAEKLKSVFETLFTKAATGSQPITDATLPKITNLEPPQGSVGTSVVIRGANMRSVTGVTFTGAGMLPVTTTADDSLAVSVPDGATNGPITLHAGREQVVSGTSFTVTH